MSANEYLRRAIALAQGGDNQSALAEVKRALEIQPDHPKGLIFRFTLEARLMRRAQRPGDAAVRYRAVLALDPDNAEAKRMLRDQPPGNDSIPARSLRSPAVAPKAPDSTAEVPAVKRSASATRSSKHPSSRAPRNEGKVRANKPKFNGMSSDMPTQPPPTMRADPGAAPPAMSGRVSRNAQAPESEPPLVEIATFERARRSTAAAAQAHVARRAEPVEELVTDEDAVSDDTDRSPDPSELPPPSVETPLEPERRIARRVALDVDVGISSESNFFSGFSGDISEGGLFIATYNLVPVGSHVHVSFGVLGHEINADAVVCWIRDPIDINLMPGFGVRFSDLSEADHVAIANFIHARAPMFFDDEDE